MSASDTRSAAVETGRKIPTSEFLEMTHQKGARTWCLPIAEKTTGGSGSLWGGMGLSAGVVALGEYTRKHVVWATCQYLGLTQRPDTMELSVEVPAEGASVSQGRVTGMAGNREIINIIGACGQRKNEVSGTWETPPAAPRPEECERIVMDVDWPSVYKHFEIRVARGLFGFSGQGERSKNGRTLLWVRMPGVINDAAALAIFADHMPSSISDAIGQSVMPTSLDITIRYASMVETEWVLCENKWTQMGNGFGQGTVNMWSETGLLMATAGQSMIVRLQDGR